MFIRVSIATKIFLNVQIFRNQQKNYDEKQKIWCQISIKLI